MGGFRGGVSGLTHPGASSRVHVQGCRNSREGRRGLRQQGGDKVCSAVKRESPACSGSRCTPHAVRGGGAGCSVTCGACETHYTQHRGKEGWLRAEEAASRVECGDGLFRCKTPHLKLNLMDAAPIVHSGGRDSNVLNYVFK